MILLLVFASVAIVTSFLCSLWEAVLLSITPTYANLKLQEKTRVGKQIDKYKKNIDQPLAAILTLNTIAHTVGAIGVGNQAAKIWGEANPFITTALVPILMTLGILVLSEIIPKTLGANQWQNLTSFTVNSLSIIITLLYPLVWMCQKVTQTMKKKEAESIFNPSEFVALAEIGVQEGKLDKMNSDILKNLMKFNIIECKSIMTPRTVIRMADENQAITEYFEENKDRPFSRIPIHESNHKDNITGYFLKTDLLRTMVEKDEKKHLKELKREIIINKETCTIFDLFNQFLEKKEHMSLIVDSFGGVSGIVTMEDIIETILGLEIVDELDKVEDMQALARQNWEKRAKLTKLIE